MGSHTMHDIACIEIANYRSIQGNSSIILFIELS